MKRLCCILVILFLLPLPCLAEETMSAQAVYRLLETGEAGTVYALFDDAMRSAMTEKELAETLPSLVASVGRLLRMGAEEITVSDPYVIKALQLEYERQYLLFQVA